MNGKNWCVEREIAVVILQGHTRDYPEMHFFMQQEVHREYEKPVIFTKVSGFQPLTVLVDGP